MLRLLETISLSILAGGYRCIQLDYIEIIQLMTREYSIYVTTNAFSK